MARTKSADALRRRRKRDELGRLWKEFEDELLEEIGAGTYAHSLAASTIGLYVESLREAARRAIKDKASEVRAIRGKRANAELTEIDGACYLHAEVAQKLWAPLLLGFLDWVWATIRTDEVPLFLLRDAGPMAYLSRQTALWPHSRGTGMVFLSRRLLGVEDQWTGRYAGKADLSKLRQYLGRAGFGQNSTVLVDTGKYGSLLKRLEQPPFGWAHQARFLVSGNEHIPGWLNVIGLDLALRTLILDSTEVFWVKKYRAIDDLDPRTLRGRRPQALLVPAGRISHELYDANGFGMMMAERRRPRRHRREVMDCESPEGFKGVLRLLKEIERAAQRAASGTWTGVLPAALPDSQDTSEFFRDWPDSLVGINPPALLPAGYRANRRTVS